MWFSFRLWEGKLGFHTISTVQFFFLTILSRIQNSYWVKCRYQCILWVENIQNTAISNPNKSNCFISHFTLCTVFVFNTRIVCDEEGADYKLPVFIHQKSGDWQNKYIYSCNAIYFLVIDPTQPNGSERDFLLLAYFIIAVAFRLNTFEEKSVRTKSAGMENPFIHILHIYLSSL